jgi:hypothetical protein
MAQTINENLRMTWDALIVAVHSAREAIAVAKKHGLTWFDLQRVECRPPGVGSARNVGHGRRRQVGEHPGFGAAIMTDEKVAECWARDDLLDAIYRVTWRTGEEMPVESARMIGPNAVISMSMDSRVEWLTVDQWLGHDAGWKRLGTIVRNAAGEYERLRVN